MGFSAVWGVCNGESGKSCCVLERSLLPDLCSVCFVALLTLARAGFYGPQFLSMESVCVVDKGLPWSYIKCHTAPLIMNQYCYSLSLTRLLCEVIDWNRKECMQ